MATQNKKSVLIICFDNIGDLVFTTCLYKPLLEIYPGANFHLLCKEYTASVAKFFPVDLAITAAEPFWDNSPGKKNGDFWSFIRNVWKLRKYKFDRIIVTSTSWKAAFFAWIIGGEKRIGFSQTKSDRFLTDKVAKPPAATPIVEDLLRLLRPLDGGAHDSGKYVLDKQKAVKICEQNLSRPLPESFVCMHPFAGDRRRCLALRHWLELASMFENAGKSVLWFASPQESRELKENGVFETSLVSSFFAKSSFVSEISLLAKADLYMGHDSGPLHLAGGFGVSVIGFYLPGLIDKTFPQGVGKAEWFYADSPENLNFDEIKSRIAEKYL